MTRLSSKLSSVQLVLLALLNNSIIADSTPMKLLRRINQQNPNLNPLQATSGSSNNEKDDDSGQGPMWFYVCLFVFLVLSSIFMFAATRNRAEEVNLSDREQIKKIITEKLIKENVLNNENAFYIIREEDGK
jgi:hypothetical protein